MKRKICTISIISAIVCVILFCGLWYTTEHNLEFEEIAVFENCIRDEYAPDDLYWFSIRDEKYNGFYDASLLEKYGVEMSHSDFDLKNYTYIVTINYELDSLKYSAAETKNRTLGLFPKQYIGIVTLKNHSTDTIRIYRTKRMDIDCDYHQRDAHVTVCE